MPLNENSLFPILVTSSTHSFTTLPDVGSFLALTLTNHSYFQLGFIMSFTLSFLSVKLCLDFVQLSACLQNSLKSLSLLCWDISPCFHVEAMATTNCKSKNLGDILPYMAWLSFSGGSKHSTSKSNCVNMWK